MNDLQKAVAAGLSRTLDIRLKDFANTKDFLSVFRREYNHRQNLYLQHDSVYANIVNESKRRLDEAKDRRDNRDRGHTSGVSSGLIKNKSAHKSPSDSAEDA